MTKYKDNYYMTTLMNLYIIFLMDTDLCLAKRTIVNCIEEFCD